MLEGSWCLLGKTCVLWMGLASCWEGPVYFTRDLMHVGRGLCIIEGAWHMLGGACYYGIGLLHAGYSVWSQGPDEFWQGPSACWEETFLWEGSGECILLEGHGTCWERA